MGCEATAPGGTVLAMLPPPPRPTAEMCTRGAGLAADVGALNFTPRLCTVLGCNV